MCVFNKKRWESLSAREKKVIKTVKKTEKIEINY